LLVDHLFEHVTQVTGRRSAQPTPCNRQSRQHPVSGEPPEQPTTDGDGRRRRGIADTPRCRQPGQPDDLPTAPGMCANSQH